MSIRVEHQAWYERRLHTRLPFRYGIAVMTEVPHVWLDLTVQCDGQRVTGRAADHLPPKWFTKDPTRDVAEEIEELRAVLRQAGTHAAGLEAATIFDLVAELERRQTASASQRVWPPLLANFGSSLVERALLDAYCHRHDTTLAAAVHRGGLGGAPGRMHPSLEGSTFSDGLPPEALSTVTCRHTVGLSDPLGTNDLRESRVDDGLPETLEEVIRTYGLHQFKIKVTAGEEGRDRLERVVAVIAAETRGKFSASLDGNETFPSIEALREFWSLARGQPALDVLWPRLRFIEQPLSRAIALDDAVGRGLRSWTDAPPLIIDESGARPEDLRRALELGYAGTSHKNCKGVLHGIANVCLLAQRRREQPGRRWLMSGEDLSNVGPVALQQDLAVQALLGNDSVERNGHHYFAGLSAWPEDVQAEVLRRYPNLYYRSARGWPTLRIDSGEISTRDVNRRAFGGAAVGSLGGSQPWFSC